MSRTFGKHVWKGTPQLPRTVLIDVIGVTDPRVNDWPLMDSPVPTVVIVAMYLYLVAILGPRLMTNRKPFQLNSVLVTYNATQVIFSIVMLWEVP
jgi:elongation of very long chain fatty acids protein 7